MGSELIVGIDFGTTHSGVSWAVNGGTQKVRLISDWPNPQSTVANNDKVPTSVSYNNGKVNHWGYNVDVKESSFKWFKLMLDPQNKHGKKAVPVQLLTQQLQQMSKTAEDVAGDYLREIWRYTTADIERLKGDKWASTYELRVVLTVPAIWSQSAKEATLRAAKAAGLPEKISLVPEPEAAALAVLKDTHAEAEEGALEPGDAFVVCDAGGGTVDLISYKIIRTDPLQIEECAIGDGGLCGSVYLDSAFEKYIKTIVGEEQYGNIRERSRRKMLQEFETMVKRPYTGEEKDSSVDLHGVEDNESVGIEDDTIKLKPSVVRTIFDHVIGQIMRLVEQQIDEVNDKSLEVKAILLVGGFGANKYMHKQLKNAHKSSGVQVLQVNGAWSSICRGATLWGLENSESTPQENRTVAARIARYHYGLAFDVPFNFGEGHQMQDRIPNAHGGYLAANQMGWFINKGDRVEEGTYFQVSVSDSVQVRWRDSGYRFFSEKLYWCADKTAPNRKEPSVMELCAVRWAIDCSTIWVNEKGYKNPFTRQKHRDVDFTFGIRLDRDKVRCVVNYRNEQVAYAEAEYKEDFGSSRRQHRGSEGSVKMNGLTESTKSLDFDSDGETLLSV